MSRERYRQMAAECFELAQQVQDRAQKARLLVMAQAWNELADKAAKAEDNNKDADER